MQTDFAREKGLFLSEIDQLKNEMIFLKTQLSYKSEEGFCLNLTHTGNDVEKLKESLQQLTTSLEQMKADYGRNEAYLRSEVDLLRNKTTLMESHYARKEVLFRSELDRLNNETALLKAHVSTKSSTPVAFTARLSHDVNLGAGQTVIFDTPLLNLGNAYHETYGHFTAPVDGIYQFAVSLLNNGKEGFFVVMKNGNEHLASLYSKQDFVPSTNVIVVQMQARDMVFVKAWTAGDLDENHYCIFSGFLIQSL